MKLELQTLRAITLGAEEITLEADGFHFHRFSAAQRELYVKSNSEDFYRKTFATSGIRMQFRTDSRKLKLTVSSISASSRSYFALDVFVNGAMIGSIDNLTEDMPLDYTLAELPLDTCTKEFSLGEGMKDVCIFLPWSVCAVIRELEMDEGATIISVRPKNKLLAFGDSITQGYDAKHPSNKYITRLALALDAEECNKAIGGEEFYPPMAEAENGSAPDYIVVAYGTNDWSHSTRERLTERCRGFYKTLSDIYPSAKMFALTPIWREDWQLEKPVGPFHDVETIIREAVSDLPNVTVIRGFDHVPKDIGFFADLRLHPNDAGFGHYFRNLLEKLRQEGHL
jgi:hypothetical protein